MKQYILMLLFLSAASRVFAQKISTEKVPAAVMNSFHKNFPDVKKAKWEIESGNYEAEYDVNKIEHSCLFSADGILLETEVEISVDKLPKSVLDYVAKNFVGKKIKEAAFITEVNGRKKYEAEVGGKDYLFDENGNLIK
jgi:hypothetical protein